jgi:hypothetical protein
MQTSVAHALELRVPDAIGQSPFYGRHGGFGVYTGLPDSHSFRGLCDEAAQFYPSATHQESWDADAEEIRGGKPRRKLLSSTAGPVQDAMYASQPLQRYLSNELGLTVVPSGNRGSYSYYAREGDFLDVHRDIETCDVALITALHDSNPAQNSGALVLYPGRVGEPLSSIRSDPRRGASLVKLYAGQTIVLFGGVVPHCVLPVAMGQLRIVSVLCFRALLGS